MKSASKPFIRAVRSAGLALTASLHTAVALAEDAEESRATAFRAVEGATAEDVPGGPLMLWAYLVALVVLVLYVARLGRMQRQTSSEVAQLAEAIARHDTER